MRSRFFLLLLLLPLLAPAQQLPVWKPRLGAVPDLNPARQQEHEQFLALAKKSKRSAEEERALQGYSARGFDENRRDIWQLERGSCSWYNGGGPQAVIASSAHAENKTVIYSAEKAHDFSLKSAWIEDKRGDGTGEWIEYQFAAGSPRISEIKIYNGYLRSEKDWQENGRVKTIRLWVNGRPRAFLELMDTPAEQHFFLPGPWGNQPDQESMRLRFEIMEVYKGSLKSSHTALSEIFFNGTNVHCFAKGSLVSMANGTTKAIENIQSGDLVLSYDLLRGEYLAAEVVSTASAVQCSLFRLSFDNGAVITTTPDHPFLLADGSWTSFDPLKSRQYLGYETLSRKTRLGDMFLLVDPTNTQHTAQLVKIEELYEPQTTYTISQLESGSSTYVVNGVVVGAEDIPDKFSMQREALHD